MYRILIAAAVILALCVATPTLAQPPSVQQSHVVTNEGYVEGSAFNADVGSFYLQVTRTATRGPNGQDQVLLYFSATKGRTWPWPETYVSYRGNGYVPGSSFAANPAGATLTIADLTLIPGYYLSGYRCDEGVCGDFTPVSPVAIDLKVNVTNQYQVEMNGTYATRGEQPGGVSYNTMQSGRSSHSTAIVQGDLAGLSLPIENPYYASASMSLSKGVWVSTCWTIQ